MYRKCKLSDEEIMHILENSDAVSETDFSRNDSDFVLDTSEEEDHVVNEQELVDEVAVSNPCLGEVY